MESVCISYKTVEVFKTLLSSHCKIVGDCVWYAMVRAKIVSGIKLLVSIKKYFIKQ